MIREHANHALSTADFARVLCPKIAQSVRCHIIWIPKKSAHCVILGPSIIMILNNVMDVIKAVIPAQVQVNLNASVVCPRTF
jgi:hypothetical protein